jgi:hypothetical protein
LDRGAWGTLEVKGASDPAIFKGDSDEHDHSGH